jgi:hypothetical protein
VEAVVAAPLPPAGTKTAGDAFEFGPATRVSGTVTVGNDAAVRVDRLVCIERFVHRCPFPGDVGDSNKIFEEAEGNRNW